MELLGVVLGGRSTIFVKKHIRLQINRTILWTDSRCVLAWILSPEIVKLRVFENNRIREIRSYPIDEYRYVPTSSNPSDLGTRGSTLAELDSNRLWIDGPEWPLTYVHNDFSSNEIVRPIDFIAPNALPGTPPISENPENPNYLPKTAERREILIEIWKETTKSIDRFWKMWYEHYLKALREHQKVTHRSLRSRNPRTPRIGEVVIIQEENAPSGTWDLGRVKELVKSSDSYIRVAKVRKSNGHVLTRAINLLYPLEVSDEPRETDDQETKLAANAVPIKLQEKPVTRTQARKLTTSLTLATIALLFILPIFFYAKYEYGIATNNSTFKAPWVAKALQSAKPAIYSFKLNPSCDPTPISSNVIVVQLYDETMHYVNKLNLVWQDRWEDEFYCLGRGQRITESPHYCDNHPCEDFGDRFCFYKHPPVAVMIIGEARIPIKAWGHVNLTTYNRKREIQTSCYSCDAKCHTEGISLIFDNGTQLIEIKSNGFEVN
uniref:DUF5641 domain-containing protein n=1 Tax=Acrobeloides nanus TaxID=290746 RepID=A0A914EKB0_9BILA